MSNFFAWLKAIIWHHKNGTLTPAPSASLPTSTLTAIPPSAAVNSVDEAHAAASVAHDALPPSITTPPPIVYAPAATPAPAAPVAPTPATVWTNGMRLADVARGFIAYEAIANEIANNPNWASACNLYANIEDLNSQPSFLAQLSQETILAVNSSCSEAFTMAVQLNGLPYANDALHIGQAYAYTLNPGNGLQVRGNNYPDALAFPNDQIVPARDLNFTGVRVTNPANPKQTIQAFIDNCNAAHAAAVASNQAAVIILGTLPIISHPQQNVATV